MSSWVGFGRAATLTDELKCCGSKEVVGHPVCNVIKCIEGRGEDANDRI